LLLRTRVSFRVPPTPAEGDKKRDGILISNGHRLKIRDLGLVELHVCDQNVGIICQARLKVCLHQMQGLLGCGKSLVLRLQNLRVVLKRAQRIGNPTVRENRPQGGQASNWPLCRQPRIPPCQRSLRFRRATWGIPPPGRSAARTDNFPVSSRWRSFRPSTCKSSGK